MAREKRLEDNETNILYVVAYIKLIEDTWKDEFTQISSSPDILELYIIRDTILPLPTRILVVMISVNMY